MSQKVLLAYLIFLHLLLGLVLMKSDFPQRVWARLGAPGPEITDHYHSMVAYHRRMDEQVPEGAVLFIGDSLTQSLAVSNVAPKAFNYGIGSDTSLGVLRRLPVYRSLERADTIVLAIGVNDLKRRDSDAIIDNYARILELIPATAGVIISAIHPVDEDLWGGPGTNRRIDEINLGLQRLARASHRRVYCDIGAELALDGGRLDPTYHNGDGIHLNAAGYATWTTALKASLASLHGAAPPNAP